MPDKGGGLEIDMKKRKCYAGLIIYMLLLAMTGCSSYAADAKGSSSPVSAAYIAPGRWYEYEAMKIIMLSEPLMWF